MTNQFYTFSRALCRIPGDSVAQGLRATGAQDPDPALFRSEHTAYVEALIDAGVSVEVLPPLEAFPDSVFIEDAALCLPEGAVVLAPGAPTRAGEADAIRAPLENHYRTVATIQQGTIDGGDILVTDREILVGLSERTTAEGVASLRAIVESWSYTVTMVDTPLGVLHFKTDCGLLDGETILATHRLAECEAFKKYHVLLVPRGEEAAANAVRVNDVVFLSAGFPKTTDLLTAAGFKVVALPTSQAALVDGGLSCLSLRFSPNT